MGAVRPVPAPTPRQDGRPSANPGAGLVDSTPLADPGPVAVLLQCIYGLEYGAREK